MPTLPGDHVGPWNQPFTGCYNDPERGHVIIQGLPLCKPRLSQDERRTPRRLTSMYSVYPCLPRMWTILRRPGAWPPSSDCLLRSQPGRISPQVLHLPPHGVIRWLGYGRLFTQHIVHFGNANDTTRGGVPRACPSSLEGGGRALDLRCLVLLLRLTSLGAGDLRK